VVSHHAFAPVVGRDLRELARARDVAPADVEPVPHNMPLRDIACSVGFHAPFSFPRFPSGLLTL
jgi:hypothetical protein